MLIMITRASVCNLTQRKHHEGKSIHKLLQNSWTVSLQFTPPAEALQYLSRTSPGHDKPSLDPPFKELKQWPWTSHADGSWFPPRGGDKAGLTQQLHSEGKYRSWRGEWHLSCLPQSLTRPVPVYQGLTQGSVHRPPPDLCPSYTLELHERTHSFFYWFIDEWFVGHVVHWHKFCLYRVYLTLIIKDFLLWISCIYQDACN